MEVTEFKGIRVSFAGYWFVGVTLIGLIVSWRHREERIYRNKAGVQCPVPSEVKGEIVNLVFLAYSLVILENEGSVEWRGLKVITQHKKTTTWRNTAVGSGWSAEGSGDLREDLPLVTCMICICPRRPGRPGEISVPWEGDCRRVAQGSLQLRSLSAWPPSGFLIAREAEEERL